MRLTLLSCALLWAVGAAAQPAPPSPSEALRCDPEQPTLERDRYFRALSLDLRGRLPSPEELDTLASEASADEVPASYLDTWLASPAFSERVLRQHRKLLWPNLDNVRLLQVNSTLQRAGPLWWRRNLSRLYRGDLVPCENAPARFAPDGTILTREVDGAQVEGYVEVVPHWDPRQQPMRICAFDAQETQVSAQGTDCSTVAAYRDAECGCGADLRWCGVGNAHLAVNRSMVAAYERLMLTLFEEGAPYTELFTTRRAFINGPLAYFYRHQTRITRFQIEPLPIDEGLLPDLAFTDEDTWVEVLLPEAHAGILTRPAYLLRFQTNRSRANRFYDAFLCTPFTPPDSGLEGVDSANLDPDLQQRGGCAYCHALLEPGAAYWGRWTEQGMGYLNAEDFPPSRSDCEACALRGQQCSSECRDFYLTRTLSEGEEPFLGMLKSYTFRKDEHVRNVEVGPRLLALSEVAQHRLPRCVAERTAEWLMGRAMSEKLDGEWIEGLARDFVANGYDYRALVRTVVTSDRYRRVH